MLFPQRLDFSDSVTGLALGASQPFKITREFHIDHIIVHLAFTVGTVMATANADSLQAILKRVVLTVADGARTRNVVDMTGPGLLEYYRQINGQLDPITNSAVMTNTTGAKNLYYPIPFMLPNLTDPYCSMLALPAPRYTSDPNLTLTIASQADMDTNGTPTFALTGTITARLIIIRRSVLVSGWPSFDTELAEATQAYGTSASNQSYELQSPGSYTGILFRCYTSATAKGDVSTASGEFKLQLLGTNIRRWRLTDLDVINGYSYNPVNVVVGTAPNFAGSYFLDFLADKNGDSQSELGSVLDANLPVTTGARLRLIQDIAGGTNVQIKYVTHRIFGQLDNLKSLNKLGGKQRSA